MENIIFILYRSNAHLKSEIAEKTFNPVKGARVCIINDSDKKIVYNTSTNKNGELSVPKELFYKSGCYEFIAEKPDFYSKYWFNINIDDI